MYRALSGELLSSPDLLLPSPQLSLVLRLLLHWDVIHSYMFQKVFIIYVSHTEHMKMLTLGLAALGGVLIGQPLQDLE